MEEQQDNIGIDNKIDELILNLRMYPINDDCGASIAVHAPYGCGKTFFAKKLEKRINEEKEFDCIYLDMFKNEYQDPMLTFLSELNTKYPNQKEKLKNSISTFVRLFSGVANKFTGIDDKTINNFADKLLEQKEHPIDQIAKSLKELSKDKKIVFLIDEIDRCNPQFSVEMLERIKHFFDIPNIVFMLFVNPNYVSQVESQFVGYGIENNGYISKFIDKSIFLETDWSETSFFSTLDYLGAIQFDYKIETLSLISHYFNLSLREIKKIDKDMSNFEKKYQNNLSWNIPLLITAFFLYALKLKHTNKFIELYKNHDTSFLKEIVDELLDKNGIYNNITNYKKYSLQVENKYDESSIEYLKKEHPADLEIVLKIEEHNKFSDTANFYPELIQYIVALYECLSRKKLPTTEDDIRTIYNQATIELAKFQYKKDSMFQYIRDIYNS